MLLGSAIAAVASWSRRSPISGSLRWHRLPRRRSRLLLMDDLRSSQSQRSTSTFTGWIRFRTGVSLGSFGGDTVSRYITAATVNTSWQKLTRRIAAINVVALSCARMRMCSIPGSPRSFGHFLPWDGPKRPKNLIFGTPTPGLCRGVISSSSGMRA